MRAAAVVLTEPGHVGATYELATRVATVRELADEAGVPVTQVPDPQVHPWLSAMFAAVAATAWMILDLLSTPTCAFMPKYH